jgi:hypothetical protein
MSEVLDVIDAFGTPLKLSWIAWLAWGVGQYFWFRYERSGSRPRPLKPTVQAKPVVPKPAPAPKPVTYPVEAPIMGRLITPVHVAAEPKMNAPHVEPRTPDLPAALDTPVPAFDPSQAVIEQFGAVDGPLDKFVRDFEMQDARPRLRRIHPPETSSYDVAEAPQTP